MYVLSALWTQSLHRVPSVLLRIAGTQIGQDMLAFVKTLGRNSSFVKEGDTSTGKQYVRSLAA